MEISDGRLTLTALRHSRLDSICLNSSHRRVGDGSTTTRATFKCLPQVREPSNESRWGGPATAVGSSPLPSLRAHVQPRIVIVMVVIGSTPPDDHGYIHNQPMTTSLIRQYYGWFNERRLSHAAGLFADDADVELIPGERAQGGSGYLRFAHAWVSAFPDGTFAIQHIEHRTETLAEVYLLATGTHQGTRFRTISIQ